MNKKTICFEREKATRIIANLNDFDGDVAAWKNAFYELWRWQMGWNFAYKMELFDGRRNGVALVMLIKSNYKDSVLSTMEDYGYRNIKAYDETVATVDLFDFGEDIADVICE